MSIVIYSGCLLLSEQQNERGSIGLEMKVGWAETSTAYA
jgi:hypothetical protein